ncbi:hypothetical protein N7449_004576 [Penicillium cf. viridicatum]|uniref:FAD-binding domain-containing protein n=1 Tax=Penicillium cf. viridicatum TaxID=2972119 RepID=A0A9W9MJM1_9EURO|nr:hypothetical protein N7449_004576 [Penicillium cf. viridicatum]
MFLDAITGRNDGDIAMPARKKQTPFFATEYKQNAPTPPAGLRRDSTTQLSPKPTIVPTAHLVLTPSTMPPLKVLICGGGIAGPALVFWLSKLGHDLTVVERFPSLRVSGQQLDLRGPGISVMKRMGLEDLFDSQSIKEAGIQFVDDHRK